MWTPSLFAYRTGARRSSVGLRRFSFVRRPCSQRLLKRNLLAGVVDVVDVEHAVHGPEIRAGRRARKPVDVRSRNGEKAAGAGSKVQGLGVLHLDHTQA